MVVSRIKMRLMFGVGRGIAMSSGNKVSFLYFLFENHISIFNIYSCVCDVSCDISFVLLSKSLMLSYNPKLSNFSDKISL